MNTWAKLDRLQFEKLGLSRNTLFATLAVAFLIYQLSSVILRPYLAHLPSFMKLLPLVCSGALWFYFIVPTTRNVLDTIPRGYFQGLRDFYMANPGSLEPSSDPEPLPLYVRDTRKPRP